MQSAQSGFLVEVVEATPNEMRFAIEETYHRIEYRKKKLEVASPRRAQQIRSQIALLEDKVRFYKLKLAEKEKNANKP